MTSPSSDKKSAIGKLIILKQFFHPHYDWERRTDDFPEWLVLGHYDSVEAHEISKLKDLLPHTQVKTSQFKYGPNSQTYIPLVLNSFYVDTLPKNRQDCKEIEYDVVFRLFIQMQLSAVTVDLMKRVPMNSDANAVSEVQFQRLAMGVDRIGATIQSILDDPRYTRLSPMLYRSMGAYEFVAELSFVNENEFKEVFLVFQDLKAIDFSRVISENKLLKNHHVFGRVNALVTFNREKILASELSGQPVESYRIVQHIRISPGHDNEALALSQSRQFPTWIGTESKNLAVEFHGGFSEYVSVMKDQLTAAIQNTGSVYSEFLFRPTDGDARNTNSTENETHHHDIRIGKLLKEIKEGMYSKLEDLDSTKSFGDVQITEFNVLLHITIQGLFRNDKQVLLLDLIPYIQAIPDYLIGFHRLAERGMLTSPERLRFLRAIDRSISFLRRAVRNRIEEMSNSGDPMSLSNRSIVSPKMMAAYSICARVVWSFLQDSTQDKAPCNACALVGTLGRVVVEEPLLGLRRKIADCSQDITAINVSKEGVWDKTNSNNPLPRLLFYDLSGPLLLRPEAVFISTVHELAEHLEWRGPHSKLDFLGEYRRMITQATLDRAAVYFIHENDKYKVEYYQDLLGKFLGVCIESSLVGERSGTNIFSAIDAIQDLISEEDIDTFISKLVLKELLLNKRRLSKKAVSAFLRKFYEFVIDAKVNYSRGYGNDVKKSAVLMKDLKSVKSVINECFADLAMFSFLYTSRCIRDASRRNRHPNEEATPCLVSHSDWTYIYYYMFEMNHVWSPDLFKELASLSHEELAKGFENPRLSEFFHRAIVFDYLVHRTNTRGFDVHKWKSVCTNRLYGLYTKFCRDKEDDELVAMRYEIFKAYLGIQMDWLQEALILSDDVNQHCIAAILWRQFEYTQKHWMKSEFSTLDHTRALAIEFIDLWDNCAKELCGIGSGSGETASTEQQRVRFLEALWCESTFVVLDGIFE